VKFNGLEIVEPFSIRCVVWLLNIRCQYWCTLFMYVVLLLYFLLLSLWKIRLKVE